MFAHINTIALGVAVKRYAPVFTDLDFVCSVSAVWIMVSRGKGGKEECKV